MINTACPPIAPYPEKETHKDLTSQVSVRFWGVRGSVPTPVETNQRYGGNTLCVEILMGQQRLIFDGGTGIVNLGQHLNQQSDSLSAHILFTHTQWDRIQGFPFFQPAFNPANHFTVYGGTAPNGASIKHCLTDQMLQPHFTLPLQNMLARLTFRTLLDGASFQIGDISVETLKINPQTEAFGYRLTWQDYRLVYATDTPNDEQASEDFITFADGADLLIYDGTYTDLSYLHHPDADKTDNTRPWDRSTEIARSANVKKLVLAHHSPVQNDTMLDQLQSQIQERFTNSAIAYEGMRI
ncbi:MAG: MBL fold metallo-hydrolase [Cyanobacteria bacterium J06650_10]